MGSIIGEGHTEVSSVSPVPSPKMKKNLWRSSVLPGGMGAPSGWRNWVSGLEKQADPDKASLLRRA